MNTNTQKVVDALKRFPAQKDGFVKIMFGKSGVELQTDILPTKEAKEVMKHLQTKVQALK